MSLYYGNTKIGSLYLGSDKIKEAYYGNVKVYEKASPAPSLPAYTLRFRLPDTTDPVASGYSNVGTWSPVDNDNSGIWDWTYQNSDWSGAFDETGLIATLIAAGDTSGVTNVSGMFSRASIALDTVFDTSGVTDFSLMFYSCNLTSVPLFNTSSAEDVSCMFQYNYNVESGALALYTQMSTQTNPPSSTDYCFDSCGSDTTTGAAELAQIPSSWGGTGA